jgi:hypothetical protein
MYSNVFIAQCISEPTCCCAALALRSSCSSINFCTKLMLSGLALLPVAAAAAAVLVPVAAYSDAARGVVGSAVCALLCAALFLSSLILKHDSKQCVVTTIHSDSSS